MFVCVSVDVSGVLRVVCWLFASSWAMVFSCYVFLLVFGIFALLCAMAPCDVEYSVSMHVVQCVLFVFIVVHVSVASL